MFNERPFPRVPAALTLGSLSGLGASFLVGTPPLPGILIAGGAMSYVVVFDYLKNFPVGARDNPTVKKVLNVFWSVVSLAVVYGHLTICTTSLQEMEKRFTFSDSIALLQVSFLITALVFICIPEIQRKFVDA